MNSKMYGIKLELNLSLFVLLIISFISLEVAAVNSPDTNGLFDLSLEQLMDVGIYTPGTLTEKNPLKSPASVTIITSEDIARTPARNILDLIEIYVPGALYLNHGTGPAPGIRGIIADRPYKFLINVNGINVNIKAYYGARLELLNWELSDIDRIEVVRGPGSVTYGPGAIGGVINIFTKKAKQALGWQAGGAFWNKYNSVGNWVSYGRVKDDFELYAYFSIVNTKGVSPDVFTTNRGGAGTTSNPYRYITGYVGKTYQLQQNYNLNRESPPATYMADYYDEPQQKAHLDIKFNENWRFWARYATESAVYVTSTSPKVQLNSGTDYSDSKFEDFRQTRFRYFQFVLENQSYLSKDLDLKSTFGMSSIDVHNIEKWWSYTAKVLDRPNHYTYTLFHNDPENLQNIGQIFSEWEYFSRFMLNYHPEDSKLKGALGFDISYDTIRPAWGKNKDNGLRLGTTSGIISGPTSDAYYGGTGTVPNGKVAWNSSSYFPVGKGFEAVDHAYIGELNYELTPKTTVILSGRIDKNIYTDYMFSPRFALIQELKKDEYLKFIIQRSVRMNALDELYINDRKGKTNFPEKLDSLELIWTKKATKHLSYQTSAFWNKNKAIAWDSTSLSAAPVGTLELFGIEAEINYQKDNFELGINHSVVKQLSWKLAEGVTTSGISYSDYYGTSTGFAINSNGNDLSNWANQATKLYTNIDLLEKKITFHGDIETFWGFEGYKKGMDALAKANGSYADNIQEVRDHDAFAAEARANISLTYHVNKSADFMVFVQNIPVFGDNKRYSYSSGQKNPYPDKTTWLEEPLVVGFTYKVRF